MAAGAELVGAGAGEAEATASVRFFVAAVFFATVFGFATVVFVVTGVVEDELDLTTCVLPVATTAISTAVSAAAAAAVRRVSPRTRRRPAARLRRCREVICKVMKTWKQAPLTSVFELPVRSMRAPSPAPGYPFSASSGMRSRTAALVAAFVAVLATAGSAVPAKPPGPVDQIKKGLARAVAAGRLDQQTAAGYAAIADRATGELGRIPPLRAQTLTGMLTDIAAQSAAYEGPWALTLFSMLAFNERTLASTPLPSSGTDRYDGDGVLYRFVTGHGFEFHPLGNFAALNTLILTGKTDEAKQLADALVARAVPKDGRLLWQYPFPFGSGAPGWRSGMVQAVAAQALARVGQALDDQELLDAAGEAYVAIPGRLVRSLPAGPWIKLYSFDAAPVLNAQLQAVISLGDYAQISGNTGAAGLAAQLQSAAETLLPKFDTGYWSLYSLNGKEAPFGYHDYVVTLLKKLASRSSDETWSDFATKFQSYETEAPKLNPSVASAADSRAEPIVIYPDPQDGYLDDARFTFWLSKLSTVTIHAGGHTASVELGHGTQTISWWPGLRAPGTYYPYLTATDAAGNSTKVSLRQVVIRALLPPVVDAHVAGRRTLVWSATDVGTPWLHLVVRLDNGSRRRYADLGHRPLAGRLVVPVPKGTWHATLVAGNSGHRAVTLDLGDVSGS